MKLEIGIITKFVAFNKDYWVYIDINYNNIANKHNEILLNKLAIYLR